MSVSDPLIKELKGLTRTLTECGTTITDETEELVQFCTVIEKCFQKGVNVRMNPIGIPKLPEAWIWMSEIAARKDSTIFAYNSIVESVQENLKVENAIGRFRLLIRTLLNRKYLHIPVGYIVRSRALASEYYGSYSILGDEILGEIFLSVALQISSLNFRLNLRNAIFLGETWQIPECLSLEYVPCKMLGMSVCFINGKALIVKLEESSVAAENEQIKLGDVLDEVNGNVISSNTRGRLRKIMKKANGLPVNVHVIKHRNKSGEYFAPIDNIIKSSGIDNLKKLIADQNLKSSEESSNNEISLHAVASNIASLNPGYILNYCGAVSTGSLGDVKQIETAMWNLSKSENLTQIPVRFEALELGVKITSISDDKTIFQQSYMEISSCGRSGHYPHQFAFIAGETNCATATNFTAHIFYLKNESEVDLILQSLGQGFERTHFAV